MQGESERRYWASLAERDSEAELVESAGGEFAGPVEKTRGELGRRGFLKAAGFSLAAAALAGCGRAPVEKAMPYLRKPADFVPGRSYFYASTCAGCEAACGVLIKNRDGRPIKLEGNAEHPLSRGGLCAAGQASLLGLYDSLRLRQPVMQGTKAEWAEVDRDISAQLEALRKGAGAVRFLTGTITSPTLRAAIGRFLSRFPNSRHVVYDPLSCSAILDAHLRTHGARVLPHYRFERAEVIVSLDADFLGTWISPVEYTAGYRAGRELSGNTPRYSYHVQFEPRMSITGTKADRRIAVAPEELSAIAAELASRIEALGAVAGARRGTKLSAWPAAGQAEGLVPAPAARAGGDAHAPMPARQAVGELAERLWSARGRSLILSGSQDVHTQVLCNYINELLGNYESTLDVSRPSLQKQGSDADLAALLEEMQAGKVAALFVANVNPVYDLPAGASLAQSLRRIPLTVSFAERVNETASQASFVCPDHHALESWSDSEPVSGVVSLTQPAIRPLGNTRSILESLATWSGALKPAYEIVRETWQQEIYPRAAKSASAFDAFWDRALNDGYAEVAPRKVAIKTFDRAVAAPALQQSRDRKGARATPSGAPAFALILYPKVSMLDGRHAHNAWLQELPDPVTKVTWDNYASFSPQTAGRLGVGNNDVVKLELDGKSLELPVFVQPGQHDSVVAVALGYGRKGTERFAQVGPRWLFGKPSTGPDGLVGKNAAPLLALESGSLRYARPGVRVTRTGRKLALACTQDHYSLTAPKRFGSISNEQRPIIQETRLAEWVKNPAAGTAGEGPERHEDLWPADHPSPNHRWAMVVDLNACTGCSACVIACQVENNIPVVGKDEIGRRRQMHWMRIDRYYTEAATSAGGDAHAPATSLGPPHATELAVAHQPMFCQQCENASCETVCPVLATVHSEEGLNQQVYNRCVGTRYCANNCAFKARRFNWFAYARNDQLQNLVLNPDVTVRSRGVMEKCSFCVQRIEEAKIEARRRGEKVADGAIQPACQQSCPAQAIVFGDLNDPNSRVSKLMANPRRYRVLEELNVRPSVGYLRIVRNRET